MHLDKPTDLPPADPGGPWYRALNRYHWYVFVVAALGWLFDCMDQRIFMVSRQAALTELLGYEYNTDGRLIHIGGSPLSKDEEVAARNDVNWYSGLATAIFMIGWATGGLFFGIMGDRWGRARTMLLTILIYSMFTGLTALSQYWWDFMFYRFITGMGVGGEFAAGVALLAEVMPARARPYALGSLQALSAVGNITGSLLSWGFTDWRWLFVVGILPALMVVLVRRRLKEPESWQQARAEQQAEKGKRAFSITVGDYTEQEPGAKQAQMGSLGEMLSDRRWRYHTIIGVLLALAGVIGLWGVGFWTFELVRLALREQGGYSDSDLRRVVAWGTALQDVGACLGMLVFSAVAARMGRRPAFAGAFILALGATLFVFGTLSRESDVYWMLPLLGFCNLMVFGGYAIYFPELYPTRLRSTGTGFCYNVARYIAAVGPFVLPAFIAAYQQMLSAGPTATEPFRYATMTVAGIYVLGLLTLPFAPETRGKPLPQ
ncbi:MAG: MFS transporter [Gemmataceae bacterium]|nr:MFS transporter [Gemmataceae bacterium]